MEFLRELRRDKAFTPLLAIALVALALRGTPVRFDNLLLGGDPWYHYKIAKTILETGEYPMWEYFTRYPFGEAVLSPPGFYYLPVVVYKLFSFTGVSFFSVFKMLPALFGVMALLPLYLLVRDLFDSKTAVGASLLYALSPAAMERSFAGFYRGEVFLVFAMLFSLYYLSLAVRKDLRYSIVSGVFLFLGALLWRGWPIALVVLGLAAGLGALRNYLLGRDSMGYAASFGSSAGLGLVFLYVFRESFYRYEPQLKETAYLLLGLKLLVLAVVGLALWSYLSRELREKPGLRLILLGAAALGVTGAFYYYVLPHYVENYSRFFETTQGIALKETTTHVWRTGIREQAKVSFDQLVSMYNILLLLFPLGIAYSVKRRGAPFLFALALSTLPLLFFQARFIFLAAPAMAAFSALALPLFLKGSRRVFVFLLLLLLTVNIFGALSHSYDARPSVSEDLYDGLLWTSKNTPEDAVILAWWDYTGPVVGIAGRRTVTHTAPSGIVESFALLLRTSNESLAEEIFKSLNEDFSLRDMKADYLLVDAKTYLMWPKILRFGPYVNYQVRVENRDLYTSMLHRFYTDTNVTKFSLVYANPDFRLYKPLFNYTRVVEVETKRYHRPGETVVLRTKTVASHPEKAAVMIRVLDPKGNEVFRKDIKRDGTAVVEFKLPENAPRGRYVAQVDVFSGDNERHSMEREFIVV
jgi:asparagine N-glycosylation enzyme membrane subunit Stt3